MKATEYKHLEELFVSLQSFIVYALNSTHCLILCNISVSILGWILIAILALAEVRNYMTPKFKEHMIVDTSLKQQLRINVNITFHSLTCNEVSSYHSYFRFVILLE